MANGQIGSPLQQQAQQPATQATAATQTRVAVAQPNQDDLVPAQAGGAAPTGYEQVIAQGGAGPVAKFEDMKVPGYPSLSVSSYRKQFLRATTAQTVRLQRALVASGYLEKDKISAMGDAFDFATQQALGWLLEDSTTNGFRPQDIIAYRVGVRAGRKPGDLQVAEGNEYGGKEWESRMTDAYVAAWGDRPPPGYLADKAQMNPEELTAYERAKVTWQQSGVAKEEQAKLASALAAHFNKPREAVAVEPQPTAPGGP